ncbi:MULTISPECIES: DUF3800 domain-containing protein [Flavobacteriaceae]|uniref:DUF3800 domain-containing protein n=2 Tax=Flavobacteriaceae TaxID=49546 RepID=A3XIZ8_LEEBM|nr:MULTISPECIES: DUF3800 domain-containing protein [Flavobacteriaceae]ADF52112.1 conserved hypothetical protein [Zunongwangia profunda SM-A87]EAQ50477.1 hypothetical protein MED217_05577 [Leeuwenhoekiella blandensis MED217]
MDFPINKIRDGQKSLAPHINFDGKYHFFYDESNNPRKLYTKETDFNSSITGSFVLGGIVDAGNVFNFKELKDSLQLQKNVKEIKFKHLASGDFISCLNSQKINTYLQFIDNEDILVHLSSINLLYYSIVDIVDSALMNRKELLDRGPHFIAELKDVMHQVLREHLDETRALFFDFKYPNISEEDIPEFIIKIIAITSYDNENVKNQKSLKILKEILDFSGMERKMPFLGGEKDNMLIEEFYQFYIKQIYMFKNSTHTFDNEDAIQKIIGRFNLIDGKRTLNNYVFKDSKSEIMIQFSDIIVGLTSKYHSFINNHPEKLIISEFEKLNDLQKSNLQLYVKIISKSDNHNPGFFHQITGTTEQSRMHTLNTLIEQE